VIPMTHSTRKVFFVLVWLSFVTIACNLSSTTEAPPTLVPRGGVNNGPAPTAQATLGLQDPVGGGGDSDDQSVQSGSPVLQVEDRLYQMMQEVNADNLYRHVEALVGFRTRHVNSSQTSATEGIGAARRYIYDQMTLIQNQSPADVNFTIMEHPFQATTGDGKTTQQYNVVGYLQGTETGAGTIVIGAHYDSRADDLLDASSNAPGAADNGSGVAVVLELARILSQKPPRATVMFVLFSAEEHNRQGSRTFVRDYIKQYDVDLIAMINIDTVGSINNTRGEINNTEIRAFSSDQPASRQLARMADFMQFGYGLTDETLKVNVMDELDREGRFGDHFSFDEEGYPAVRFIEAFEDHYNRETRDTLDKVEPEYMVSAAQTILSYMMALSDGPRPPQNISLRDDGNGMRSLVWDPVSGADQYYVVLRRPGSLAYDNWFPWNDNITNPTDIWGDYAALAIAAVDESGVIGPLSAEYPIQ